MPSTAVAVAATANDALVQRRYGLRAVGKVWVDMGFSLRMRPGCRVIHGRNRRSRPASGGCPNFAAAPAAARSPAGPAPARKVSRIDQVTVGQPQIVQQLRLTPLPQVLLV